MACPLWWIFPIGTRDELASRAKAKRSVFRVFQRKLSLEETVFRGMIVLVKGDAMKVVLGHVTAHRSWNRPSNVRDGGLQGR